MCRANCLLLLIVSCLWTLLLGTPVSATASDEHFRRALEFRFNGDIDAAIVEYRHALELDPNSVQGHDLLGLLLLEERGDLDGAISEFMTALRIDPRCNFCQLHLNQAVDLRNNTAAEHIARGNQLYGTGELHRAAAAYRIAVQIDPKDAVAHNSLAWTLYKLGSLKEGSREIELALKLKPEDPEFINTLACILYEKGDVDGALDNWRKAIALSKTPGAADLYGLAIGLLAKGDTSGAAKYFEQAVKADSKYLDATYIRDRIGMSVHALAGHDRLLSLVKPEK